VHPCACCFGSKINSAEHYIVAEALISIYAQKQVIQIVFAYFSSKELLFRAWVTRNVWAAEHRPCSLRAPHLILVKLVQKGDARVLEIRSQNQLGQSNLCCHKRFKRVNFCFAETVTYPYLVISWEWYRQENDVLQEWTSVSSRDRKMTALLLLALRLRRVKAARQTTLREVIAPEARAETCGGRDSSIKATFMPCLLAMSSIVTERKLDSIWKVKGANMCEMLFQSRSSGFGPKRKVQELCV